MAIYLIIMHESAYFERQRAGQVDIHDHTCLRAGQRRLGRWFVVSCIVEGFLGLRKLILVLRRELLTQFNFKSLGPRPDLYPNFSCTISMFPYTSDMFLQSSWNSGSNPVRSSKWHGCEGILLSQVLCNETICWNTHKWIFQYIPIYSNISIYNIFQSVSHNFHYVPMVQLVEHLTKPIFQFGG